MLLLRTSLVTVLSVALFIASHTLATAQCVVNSSNGYSVNMSVYPQAIETTAISCPHGYNYKVRMAYNITFSGTNIPAEMYTLQGTVTCGSTSIFFDLPNNGGSGTVLSSNAYSSMTNCATATPASLGCNTVTIQIEGPSLSSRTVNCSFSSLPIELLDFNAKPANDIVDLSWVTGSEHGNDYFTVERSRDGGTFEEVLLLSGAGNSAQQVHYEAQDPKPLDGVSYYRLRQTDLDGSSTWSPVVAVERRRAIGLSVYPNPLVGERFDLPADAVGSTLVILSASGAQLYTSIVGSTAVVIPPLPPGIYQVRLTGGEAGAVRSTLLMKG